MNRKTDQLSVPELAETFDFRDIKVVNDVLFTSTMFQMSLVLIAQAVSRLQSSLFSCIGSLIGR